MKIVDCIGPDLKLNLEKSMGNNVCPGCSCSGAFDVDRAGTDAEQLATLAATMRLETTQLLVQLAEIMEGFKQAVGNGGQVVDGDLGNSLGAILLAVERVKDELEKMASFAVAKSSTKLAQIAESLRLDIRSLIQANNTH